LPRPALVRFRVRLLDVLRGALDQVLGLLETETGDAADFLDDADLVRAGILEDDGELGLSLGGRSGASSGATRGSGGGDGSGGRNAPLALEVFDQRGEFENRLAREPLDDLFLGDVAHGIWLPWSD